MKKIMFTAVTLFISLVAFAQDITGKWNGVLKIPGVQLRIVFNLNKADTGHSATMDSPDQGVKGIPVTSVSFQHPTLKLAIANAGIQYEGVLKNDSIIGVFKQGAQSFPLNVYRDKNAKKTVRPQEPVKPFSYYSEDVSFENRKAGIRLAGTLTLPNKDGVYPVAILISGSGPQNRDEELLEHKPFLVLSDHLTKNGIAVLRFDDRGVGASGGDFKTATTADFATDVEACMAYLKTRKEINVNQIGLVGHSEGGIIAPMVASRTGDVAFIVLLAGTGIPGNELLLLQQQLIGEASGESKVEIQKGIAVNKKIFDVIRKSKTTEESTGQLREILKKAIKENPELKPAELSEENFINAQIAQASSPWIRFFIKYDPGIALQKVKCPVLALNGSKDLQVPAKQNLSAIAVALKKAGNKKVTIKELPNLNHLFQEAKTGAPSEYAVIEQTFSPAALQEVSQWIKDIIK
jgi:pimeloyl-ACP methyl ester carboxylesterase